MPASHEPAIWIMNQPSSLIIRYSIPSFTDLGDGLWLGLPHDYRLFKRMSYQLMIKSAFPPQKIDEKKSSVNGFSCQQTNVG